MKKKCLAALMMVTVLALTACGAKETTEDSHQTEEQVTDTCLLYTSKNHQKKLTEKWTSLCSCDKINYV